MGGKTSTTTQKVQIPQEILDRYNAVNAQAQQVSQTPFQIYGTEASDFVAPLNQQQQQGIQNVNTAAGAYRPYFDTATAAGTAGMASAQPQDLNLEQFYNPYQQQVIDATMRQMGQANEQAQSGALGTAASSGAFGGDRAGIAAANLSNQQGLAMGSTLAGLNAQNYNQALAAAQQQQGVQLGATQADLARLMQGGQFMAGLGQAAQQAGLQGAEAQINAGTLGQQTEQAGISALYNQFQQQNAYPFQVAQFLANIAMGTGALSGSTTTTTQPTSFFSDRRLKEDIRRIGHTDDGMPIYKYKYKGDDNHQTHIGFMADEVEKVKPDAVGVSGGYKTVDYDRATKADGGGVVGPYGAQFGSQNPYGAGYVPQAILPVGQLMVADSGALQNSQQNLAQMLEASANFGENLVNLKQNFGKGGDFYMTNAQRRAMAAANEQPQPAVAQYRGGVVHRATGGATYLQDQKSGAENPVRGQGYLSDTLAQQEEQKPAQLQSPGSAPGASGGTGLQNLASAAGTVAGLGTAAKGIGMLAAGTAGAGSTLMSALPFLAMSDRRMKHDIRRIGKTDHGMPIYSFKYKGDDREQTHIGFMADEVEKHHPDAVMTGEDGYKRVDYGQSHKFYQGGVVRPSYATDGAVAAPPEADEARRRLLADDVPAVQTLGSLPDARVMPASETAGVAAPPVERPALTAEDMMRLRLSTGDAMPPANLGARPVPAAAVAEQPRLAFPQGNFVPAAGGVAPVRDTAPAVVAPVAADYPVAQPAGATTQQPGVVGPMVDTGIVPAGGYSPIVPLKTQLDFVMHELAMPQYNSFLQTEYETPEQAAIGFEKIYERANGAGNDRAAAYARDVYSAASNGDMSDLTPNAVAAFEYFTANGMDPIKAAGATGRLMVESYAHMDPNARNTIGGGYGTYGIAQWRGPRIEALADFSGVPLEAIKSAPVSTPEGRYYSTGVADGSRVSTSTRDAGVAGGYGIGGDKPYEDRTRLGQMFYDRDGRVNKDALLSILGGVGAMASSPSLYLGSAILQGIGGAANTYAGLERQAADIRVQDATAMETATRTAKDSIFAVDGVNMIRTPEGMVPFWEFLENGGISTGDKIADDMLRRTGKSAQVSGFDINTMDFGPTISAPPNASVEQGRGPGNVLWGDASTAALEQDRDLMRSQPAAWASYVAQTGEILPAITAERANAVAGKPNVNEMAYMIGSAINEGNMGSFGEWYANNIVKPLQTFLPEGWTEGFGEPATQSAILEKLKTLSATDMTPEQQRAAAVFQQVSSIYPNLDMPAEAAAAITASVMLNNQTDIDRANYYNYYLQQQPTGRGALVNADAAFAQEYSQLHQVEKANLTDLFSMADDPNKGAAVRRFLEDVHYGRISQGEAQELLTRILGPENASPALSRYFIKGM